MINLNDITTIFLDMDGTLLDLRFDNHFWLEHVPQRYGEKHGYSLGQAKNELYGRYESMKGTLQWYCVDYWSEELDLDIAMLKEELTHLISIHPHVIDFLKTSRSMDKRLILLTNAHTKSIKVKFAKTGLDRYFDRIISSHTLGEPKESARFWPLLYEYEAYDPRSTLLIDDNIEVLRAAANSGICHLLAVKRPDTGRGDVNSKEFEAIESFAEIWLQTD